MKQECRNCRNWNGFRTPRNRGLCLNPREGDVQHPHFSGARASCNKFRPKRWGDQGFIAAWLRSSNIKNHGRDSAQGGQNER